MLHFCSKPGSLRRNGHGKDSGVVRGAGLEPAQYCYRQDLNLVRLPISPPALLKKTTGIRISLQIPA